MTNLGQHNQEMRDAVEDYLARVDAAMEDYERRVRGILGEMRTGELKEVPMPMKTVKTVDHRDR